MKLEEVLVPGGMNSTKKYLNAFKLTISRDEALDIISQLSEQIKDRPFYGEPFFPLERDEEMYLHTKRDRYFTISIQK